MPDCNEPTHPRANELEENSPNAEDDAERTIIESRATGNFVPVTDETWTDVTQRFAELTHEG